MAADRTLAILKPDCVERELVGPCIARIQEAGFAIRGLKMIRMSRAQAERFYAVHSDRPFFDELTAFMSGGPCVPLVLEKENAIEDFRALIGATDPSEAEDGTIRAEYADSVGENIVHGADSPANADREIGFFFSDYELIGASPGEAA